MAVDRIERVNSLLKRVIGEAMFRVLQGADFQAVLVTVTNVSCASDLRDATVSVSIFGDEDLQNRAIRHIQHRARDFQRAIASEVKLKFTPLLHFRLDHSLEKGDKVLQILDKL